MALRETDNFAKNRALQGAIFSVCIAAAFAFVLYWFLYSNARTHLSDVNHSIAQQYQNLFKKLKDQTAGLAKQLSEINAEDANTIDTLFRGSLLQTPDLFQLRVLSIDGKELIRLNQNMPGQIWVTKAQDLQDKSTSSYYLDAVNNSGKMVFSRINLNVENGQVQEPWVVTIRTAMRFRFNDGTDAVLVLNSDVQRYLDTDPLHTDDSIVEVFDDQGIYIIHDDRSKRFGNQQNNGFRLTDHDPDLFKLHQHESMFTHQLTFWDTLITKMSDNDPRSLYISTRLEGKPVLTYLVVLFFVSLIIFVIVYQFTYRSAIQRVRLAKAERLQKLALDKERAIFASILNSFSFPCLYFSPQRKLAFFNINGSNWELTNISDIVDGAALSSLSQLNISVQEQTSLEATFNGKNVEFIKEYRRGEKTFHIQVAGTPVLAFDGNGALITFTDLSEIVEQKNTALKMREDIAKKALEIQKTSKAKEEFLANMSHEIRTPLNGIYGGLQLIKRENLSDDGKNFVQKALQSCKNLLSIINDILDISKIAAGKLEIENVDFQLSTIVDLIHSDLSPIAHEKGTEFVIKNQVEHDFWFGDPVRINQILLNLSSNAVKFTENGTVELIIEETTEPRGLIFKVKDTGIGMDKEQLESVFERFQQADASTTRKFGGTGLGLSICMSLVDLMEGEISAQSQPGKGSTFEFSLPLTLGKEKATEEKQTEKKVDFTGKRVLFAEDNEINQEIFKAMLEPYGLDIKVVDNGQLAVDAVSSFDPEMVFLDIQMPVMDGIGACLHIKAAQEALPVVALTANVMKKDVDAYHEIGFDGHLPKPFDVQDLERTLLKYLS